MTRRVLIAALAAALVLPASAAAQLFPGAGPAGLDAWGPRYRITPFIANLTSIDRLEEWTFQDDNNFVYMQSDVSIGRGTGFGLHLEAPVRGSFGVSAAAGYARRGETLFTVLETGDMRRVDGMNVLFARVGPSYHMLGEQSEIVLRRLAASAFAGAVVMHERPRNRLGTGDLLSNATHFGLNLGVSGELPFAEDRYAVQLGIENNMMFWNESALAALPFEYFGRPGTARSQTTLRTSMSHAWLLRAGLSMRVP
jgi:hypothetical protein